MVLNRLDDDVELRNVLNLCFKDKKERPQMEQLLAFIEAWKPEQWSI